MLKRTPDLRSRCLNYFLAGFLVFERICRVRIIRDGDDLDKKDFRLNLKLSLGIRNKILTGGASAYDEFRLKALEDAADSGGLRGSHRSRPCSSSSSP